jgi:hypothetical protein
MLVDKCQDGQIPGYALRKSTSEVGSVYTLNPATLLPSAAGPPDHNRVEVINEFVSSHPNFCDQPDHNFSQMGTVSSKRKQDTMALQ